MMSLEEIIAVNERASEIGAARRLLEDLNDALNAYGVEDMLRNEYNHLNFIHVNVGDIYKPTVIYDLKHRAFYIMSLDAWIGWKARVEFKKLKAEFHAIEGDRPNLGAKVVALFDVAAELHNRGHEVPSDWVYKPSRMQGQPVSECWADVFPDYGAETLVAFGEYLRRLGDDC